MTSLPTQQRERVPLLRGQIPWEVLRHNQSAWNSEIVNSQVKWLCLHRVSSSIRKWTSPDHAEKVQILRSIVRLISKQNEQYEQKLSEIDKQVQNRFEGSFLKCTRLTVQCGMNSVVLCFRIVLSL